MVRINCSQEQYSRPVTDNSEEYCSQDSDINLMTSIDDQPNTHVHRNSAPFRHNPSHQLIELSPTVSCASAHPLTSHNPSRDLHPDIIGIQIQCDTNFLQDTKEHKKFDATFEQ